MTFANIVSYVGCGLFVIGLAIYFYMASLTNKEPEKTEEK